jgi:drug/metabolite transporter (DMT)-like permease
LTRPLLFGLLLALLGGTIIALGDACTTALSGGLSSPACSWRDISKPEVEGWSFLPFSEFVQGKAFFGNFLALAGAWSVAGYLMIGRRLRASIALIPYIFIVFGSAAICLLGAMTLAGESPRGYSPVIYLWILLLALLPQLVSHTIYNWALRYLPAVLVSVATLAEPVGAAILAYAILHEAPTRLTALGGVLILAGIYLAARTQTNG